MRIPNKLLHLLSVLLIPCHYLSKYLIIFVRYMTYLTNHGHLKKQLIMVMSKKQVLSLPTLFNIDVLTILIYFVHNYFVLILYASTAKLITVRQLHFSL
jgi:hypothetical protein